MVWMLAFRMEAQHRTDQIDANNKNENGEPEWMLGSPFGLCGFRV